MATLTGCCSTAKKKVDPKDPALKDAVVKLYLDELEDDEALKNGDNRFIDWENRKNMLKYSVKKARIHKDYDKEEARKNKYYKEAMIHVMSNDLEKALTELQKADSSLTSNGYIKSIYKAIEMRHLKNLAFNDQEMKRSASALINGRYNIASRSASKVIMGNENSKNLFLLREAYRIKYTAATLEKDVPGAKSAYQMYLQIDKKIRDVYNGTE